MFADLHIHMILDGVYYRAAIDSHKQAPQDDLICSRLADYRARGIKLLRDGGDAWGVGLRARDLAGAYGIDYRTPVFPIYKKGHYGSFIGRGFSDWDEYRTLLDEVHEKRGDFVKLMISGIIDFSQPETLSEAGIDADTICRMIELARNEGFAVMVHANGDKAVNAAIDAGAASVEHGAFLGPATLERLAKQGILWVPTLSAIGNLIGCGRFPDAVLQPLLKSQQEKISAYVAHGGLIGLGSDAGAYRVFHGQAAADEFAYLRSALGAQTEAVLRCGEDYAARTFRYI